MQGTLTNAVSGEDLGIVLHKFLALILAKGRRLVHLCAWGPYEHNSGRQSQYGSYRSFPFDVLTLHKSASDCCSSFVITVRLPIGVKCFIRGM